MSALGPPAILLGVLGVVLALVVCARLGQRGRGEFRVRVLETLAAATRRGVAVEPQFLWQIAHDVRGPRRRAVLRVAALVDAGEPLGTSLATGLSLPPAVAATVRSAEGGAGLGRALTAAARLDRDHSGTFHRLLLALTLPGVTLAIAAVVPVGQLLRSVDSTAIDASELETAVRVIHGAAWVLGGVVALLCLSRIAPIACVLERLGRLRRRPRLRDVAGWLAALASAVRAGRPLDAALARTAPALGTPRLARRVVTAAARLRDGAALESVWTDLPLPRWVVSRSALLHGSTATLAGALDDMAARADERADATRERFFRLLAPSLALVTGLVVGGLFLAILTLTQRIAMAAAPW